MFYVGNGGVRRTFVVGALELVGVEGLRDGGAVDIQGIRYATYSM